MRALLTVFTLLKRGERCAKKGAWKSDRAQPEGRAGSGCRAAPTIFSFSFQVGAKNFTDAGGSFSEKVKPPSRAVRHRL